MNDRLRFRLPIYGADGKFKKFVYWDAKMSKKPRFKVGQDIWFRYKQNRPAPVSVLGYGKKPKTYDICSLEGVFILQDVEEQYLYATEKEAYAANH